MKPSPRSDPFLSQGSLSDPNMNFHHSETVGLSRSSHGSIKPLNFGAEVSDSHGISFTSDISLPKAKKEFTIGGKSRQKRIQRVITTKEVDAWEESSPLQITNKTGKLAVSSKQHAKTQRDVKPISSGTRSILISESSKIHNDSKKTIDAGLSEIIDKKENTKSILFSKKKVIVQVKTKRNILESPLALEKMFPKLGETLQNKRRKSCHCEWCGGLSHLEKKLDRNPLLALAPRKKKPRRRKDYSNELRRKDDEEPQKARSKITITKGRGRLHTQNIFRVKGLLHSKTISPHKNAVSLVNLKSHSPAHPHSGILENEIKSLLNLHETLNDSKVRNGSRKQSEKLNKEASFVIEQDEEGQNVSLAEVQNGNTKKGKRKGKKLPKEVKLGIKMKKVLEQNNDNDNDNKIMLDPSQEQQKSKLSIKLSTNFSPKREFKSERNQTLTKKSVQHRHYHPEKPIQKKNIRPNSPIFDEKSTRTTSSAILDIYSRKHSFPYNTNSGLRISTEPSPQNREISYSIFSPKRNTPVLLNQKPSKNLIDLTKLGFIKFWNLSHVKNTVLEQKHQSILSSRVANNKSVQERHLSPVNLPSPKSGKIETGQLRIEKLYRRK